MIFWAAAMEGSQTVITPHPLRIDVGDLVRQPGASTDFEIEANVPGLAVGLGKVKDEGAVVGAVKLEALMEGVLVTGQISGEFELECARCLKPFDDAFSTTLSEVYAYPDQEIEDEDGFVIDDGIIDLEPAVRDEILLAVPLVPLHDPDCKGLCAVCGQDRNITDCGHSQEHVDIRWEPLRRLREGIGE